jgi:replicative DNA helicase
MTDNLPYDIQAESGIVATLIYIPEFVLHSEYLKPEYFFIKENQCIYWAIQSLYKDDKVDKIDTFNLTTKINSNKGVRNIIEKLNINSIQELIDLSKNVARDTIEEYKLLVNRVVSLSFKRDLYKKLQYFEGKCLDEKEDNLSHLSTLIYNDLNILAEKYITNNEIKTFGEIVDDLWNEICKRRAENGVYGIPSKYPILNEYFTYEPQELILFKARMKKGKSIFLMNEAVHKIKSGVPTAYFDSELSSRQFFERLLSHLTKIPVKKIKQGSYTQSEEDLILDTMKWIKSKPFTHIYNPVWTLDQIYTHCKILQNKINLQFLVYDYIKSNTKVASEQYNELGAMCDFLKNNIAGGLKLSVLAAAQLNRQGQTADSDKLDRYASVSLMWREKTDEEIVSDGKECGNFALTVNLNRLGEQMPEDDYLDFVFGGNTISVEQALQQHEKTELNF